MDRVLSKLYSLQRRGISPGLERITWILEQLDNPHMTLRPYHVAGTNGKGTVCSVIASILTEAGETVGLYTSPHIQSFTERIRVNGIPIEWEECLHIFETVEPLVDAVNATFFEITTVMAITKFLPNTTQTVIETGLGGRLDATNVIIPHMSIITSIDYDHQEWLGTTLQDIAREKAGIIKPSAPVIVGEQRPELRNVFAEQAERVGASRCIFLDEIFVESQILEHTVAGMELRLSVGEWQFDRLFIPLHGEHQVKNVALALATLQQGWAYPSEFRSIVAEGLRNIRQNSGLRARIEVVCRDPLIVLDVAHNLAGCHALIRVISSPPFPPSWQVVFGVMKDKDYAAMVKALSSITDHFYFAAPRTDRAAQADALQAAADACNAKSTCYPSIREALCSAIKTRLPILCVGSFFVIEEALEVLEELGIESKNTHDRAIRS